MFRQAKPGFIEVEELIQSVFEGYPSILEVQEKLRKLYKDQKLQYKSECIELGIEWSDEVEKANPWKGIQQYRYVEYRTSDGKFVEESLAKSKKAELWVYMDDNPSWPNANTLTKDHKTPGHIEYRFYQPIHPITKKKCTVPQRGWLWCEKDKGNGTMSFEKLAKNNLIFFREDETTVPRVKKFLKNIQSDVVKSVLPDFTDGEKELAHIQGERGSFPNPKPTTLIRKLIAASYTQGEIIMDYFAGSGTTAHAILGLNKIDEGNRNYLLMEMGKYFDSTLKRRLLRVLFALNWNDGKPKPNSGIKNHILKYLVLEQYEDVLDAIEQFEGETPKNLPLKYLYKPELNKINSTLDLSKPFSNKIKYGQPTKEGFVDLVDTYNYLQGYEIKSIKPYNIGKKYYKVVETADSLVVWRDIVLGEDDSKAIKEIAEKYPDATQIEVNYDFNILATLKDKQLEVGKRMLGLTVIHADIFNL